MKQEQQMTKVAVNNNALLYGIGMCINMVC